MASALNHLKPEKSTGLDSIFPEFVLHAESAIKSWLCGSVTSCMPQLKISRIWRRAFPISLLCVPFKILERLIYARVEPIIDPLLMQEQVGFRHERSTVDQVTLPTQDIQVSFLAKRKARAVFVLQQPSILYGIAASPASYCNCSLTNTWSA